MSDTAPAPTAPRPAGPRNLLSFLFGMSAPVDRASYAITGFALMFLKYVIDAGVVYLATGARWTPVDYLNPVASMRSEVLGPSTMGLQVAMALWALPFLWIGVSMTMRRAWDAGFSPWWGLVFFVPLVNYVMMVVLCATHSRPHAEQGAGDAYAGPAGESLRSALVSVVVALGVTAIGMTVSVYALGGYGISLFLGTPFLMGAVSAFLFNRRVARKTSETLGVAAVATVMACGLLLLFAMEGAICIAMVLPVAIFFAFMGAVLGRGIALMGSGALFPALVTAGLGSPGLAGIESWMAEPAAFQVTTSVVVDAPPSAVWPNVIRFSELPPPSWLLFRLGIAHPLRARIEGAGVGAVRHCEFSTGAFVEPITVWDEPRRLGFDVIAQPAPMHEWSPYRDVHPPHLDGYFRSTRGEFLLTELDDGRTRLDGTTWYELELYPSVYWRLWSDFLVHRIHRRVLAHVAAETERGA